MERFLSRISRHYRAVLRLLLQDYTYREIADKLDVPAGTVMSRIHRARGQAEKLLRPHLTSSPAVGNDGSDSNQPALGLERRL